MSRTNHNTKGPGYEYWSRRPYWMASPGRRSKKITHRLERAAEKRLLDSERAA